MDMVFAISVFVQNYYTLMKDDKRLMYMFLYISIFFVSACCLCRSFKSWLISVLFFGGFALLLYKG